MENEIIKTFDENGNEVGVATREEVHRVGHWHEAFHCWFISKETDGKVYIYLQLRSKTKKDYPDLLDITAAGHLLAHETVYDGIREVKEEIGIDVSFDELTSLGVIRYCIIKGEFIDRELAHVFVYDYKKAIDEFILQPEEVAGIVKVDFDHFAELWMGNRNEIVIEGFKLNESGRKTEINEIVNKEKFVEHESSYYESIIKSIRENLS